MPSNKKPQQPDQQGSGLPVGLSMPARRTLIAGGYWRLEQLTEITEAELARLHGVGPKAIGQLRSALAAHGLAFAEETKG